MRWAFFLLLFVNAGFFIWQETQSPRSEVDAPKPVKSTSGKKTILLLHEVNQNSKSMADIMESGNSKPIRETAKLDAPKQEMEPEARALRDTTRNDAPPELTEIEKQVAAVEARHTQRIEAAIAARAVEDAPPPREARARDTSTPRIEPSPVAETRVCYSLGPFGQKAPADASVAKLASIGFAATTREKQLSVTTRWWVIDATRDERAAQKRLTDLRKKDITNATVIEEGDYQNMILLGKYDNEGEATKRLNTLVKLGFKPVMEKRDDAVVQYWVDYEETNKRAVNDAQWKDVMAGVKGLTKESRTCK